MAWWCFDDPDRIGADCSRGGFDGAVAGTVTDTAGIVGRAAHFDGQSWIDLPSPFFLDGLCETSLSAFFLHADGEWMGQILGGGDVRGSTDPLSFQLVRGRFTNLGYEDTAARTWIKTPWDDETPRYEPGRWHHLATTLAPGGDGAQLQVYIDGALVVDVERPGERCIGYDIPMPTAIGAIHGTQTWKGALDELRVYNRALTPEEVALLAAPMRR